MVPYRGITIRHLAVFFVLLSVVAVVVFLIVQYFLDQQSITWRENAQIKDGMTQVEVEAVLGAPHSIETQSDGGTTVRWIGRKQGMILVEFHASGAMQRKLFVFDAVDYKLSFFPRAME